MKKFGLLVGNEFTLDFIEPKGFHSSRPLKNFNSSKIKYQSDFMNHLSEIQKLQSNRNLNDFEAIENYVEKFKEIEEEYYSLPLHKKSAYVEDPIYDIASKRHLQLRRFLAMAYSVLQREIDKQDMSDWKWAAWLLRNNANLSFAISLNYDLTLENALTASNSHYYRVGTNEFPKAIPIIKPHGSIDFDLPNLIGENIDPWKVSAHLNDMQRVEVIPKADWLTPRMEADIIVPSLHNVQSHLSWVEEMFEQYSTAAKSLDALVIVGCSYWGVDRPEIDLMLSQLRRRTKVYVVDLRLCKDLKKKIQSLGLSYREVTGDCLPW